MKRILIGLGFLLAIVFSLLYVSKYNYLLTGVSTIYLTGHTRMASLLPLAAAGDC
ncbi:MAG: hypothetical protein ACPG7V_02460 [Flavobacteriaceae bacterium]